MDEHKATLSLDIRKLKQGFKDATVISQNFTKQLEKTKRFTEDAFGNIVPIRQFSGEIAKQNKLYSEQQRMLKSINVLQKNKKALGSLGGISTAEGNNYMGYMASFKRNTKEATAEVKTLDKSMDDTSRVSSRIGGEISKSFTKGLKSVKRLTLGFLGARTAFSLFRKYMSEYQSQNEEFANKMQLTTSVITNALAPAFEFFGNVVQYAVIGLARIIELLTGVNILGKTIDNSFKGASQSAKEFNDNLSGLDEISNIQEDSGGLSTGIGSQLKALDDFQKKIAEVDKWLEETGIKKFFEDLRPILKDVFGWISEHPLGTLGILAGLEALKLILPGVLGTAGGTAGLLGLATVLGAISVYGIIKVGVEFINTKQQIEDEIEGWKDLQEQIENLKEGQQDFINKLNGDATSDVFNKYSNWAKTNAENLSIQKQEIDANREAEGLFAYTIKSALGEHEAEDEMIKTKTDSLLENLDMMKKLEEQGKLSRKEEIEYANTLTIVKDALEKSGLKGKNYEEILKNIDGELNNLKGKNVTATIDVDANFSKAETKSQNWFTKTIGYWKSGFNSMFGTNFKANGGIFAGHWQPITAYAGGGSPNAGQMFVAREAGPEMVGTIRGHTAVMNNDQIVASVSSGVYEAVMAAMGGQGDRPIVLNVNGKELAKVTYGDFQEESSRRGTNTSIRRV